MIHLLVLIGLVAGFASTPDHLLTDRPVGRVVAMAGDYFVDPTFTGVSGDGTDPAAPLKDLVVLRAMLGSPVDRSGVRFWLKSGTTFAIGATPLRIEAWGTAGAPIRIGSYRSAMRLPSGGLSIDRVDNASREPGARLVGLGAGSTTIGLLLIGCRFIELVGLEATGFNNGIILRGVENASVTGCFSHTNGTRGVFLQHLTVGGVNHGSRHITVEDCCLRDNGSDTSGSNLALGLMAGNCTVRLCEFYSTLPGMGVDGILFASSSSGHLIERNVVRDMSRNKMGGDGDGIDLKAVFQRDLRDGWATTIRDNFILRNAGDGIVIHNGCRDLSIYRNQIEQNHYGINLLPGTVDSDGDLVEADVNPYGPSGVRAWFAVSERLRITCNRIVENREHGVFVDMKVTPTGAVCGGGTSSCVGRLHGSIYRDVSITFNTIDDNQKHGIAVARSFTSAERAELLDPAIAGTLTFGFFRRRLENIRIRGNLMRRNACTVTTAHGAYAQLMIANVVDGTASGESDLGEFDIDFNVFEPPALQPVADLRRVTIRRWAYDSVALMYVGGPPSESRMTLTQLESIGFHGGTRVIGSASAFGSGCAGTGGAVPDLRVPTLEPLNAKEMVFEVTDVRPSAITVFVLGLSRTTWVGSSLPLSLAIFGANPLCELRTSIELTQLVAADGSGFARIPSVLALSSLALPFYAQAVVLDVGAVGSLVVSNALELNYGGTL